jgi:hypothetical protein
MSLVLLMCSEWPDVCEACEVSCDTDDRSTRDKTASYTRDAFRGSFESVANPDVAFDETEAKFPRPPSFVRATYRRPTAYKDATLMVSKRQVAMHRWLR